MHHLKYLGLAVCFISMGAFAQENKAGQMIIKGVTTSGEKIAQQAAGRVQKEAWLEGLSKSTLDAYMLSNEALLKEMKQGSSWVGLPDHIKYNQWKKRTQFLGSDLSRKLAAGITKYQPTQEHFPGYYVSFPHTWGKKAAVLNELRGFEVILEGAYGPEARYEAEFLPDLNSVLEFATRPVIHGAPASAALEQGLEQALAQKHGFFVLAVKGNTRRPKDVLLLDLYKKQFVSLYKTQSVLWSRENARLARAQEGIADPEEERYNLLLKDHVFDGRATSGVLFSVESIVRLKKQGLWQAKSYRAPELQGESALDKPFTVMISHDGKSWAVFDINSTEGKNIFRAFSRKYYIYFEPKDVPQQSVAWEEKDGVIYYQPKDFVLSFATSKGGQLFPTVHEAENTPKY